MGFFPLQKWEKLIILLFFQKKYSYPPFNKGGPGGIYYPKSLLLISLPDFETICSRNNRSIDRTAFSITSDLAPIPFRPEDFTEEDPLVREILETGVKVV